MANSRLGLEWVALLMSLLGTKWSSTMAMCFKADANSEKQKLAEVNVVAGEKIERSGILYVFNIIGTVFQSYWSVSYTHLVALLRDLKTLKKLTAKILPQHSESVLTPLTRLL